MDSTYYSFLRRRQKKNLKRMRHLEQFSGYSFSCEINFVKRKAEGKNKVGEENGEKWFTLSWIMSLMAFMWEQYFFGNFILICFFFQNKNCWRAREKAI